MNFMITGGTGFLGTHLTKALKKQGHHVFILTRSADQHEDQDNETYIDYDVQVNQLPQIYAVINLAGDSIFGYWSENKKERILSSRIETTEKVIQMMEQMDNKPTVFISGSAVGFYGMSDEVIFTENTVTPGDDFLAQVVISWEKTASQANKLGIRTIYTRFGIILGEKGALPLMSLPVKLGVGGKIGKGDQWMSWIHAQDAVNMIIYCVLHDHIEGPINVTSPEPQRNKAFMIKLAKSLRRPYFIPAPAFLIKIAMGEMSQLITKGQYVLPQKACDHGFKFLYPTLEQALNQIIKE